MDYIKKKNNLMQTQLLLYEQNRGVTTAVAKKKHTYNNDNMIAHVRIYTMYSNIKYFIKPSTVTAASVLYNNV